MELMPEFGLEGFEKEYPHARSGGMKQRAAFLRTVLADQEVFLLDEPFGALDALTHSPMTAPMTLTAMAILMPENRNGRDDGS